MTLAEELNHKSNTHNFIIKNMDEKLKKDYEDELKIMMDARTLYENLLDSWEIPYLADKGHKEFVVFYTLINYSEINVDLFDNTFKFLCVNDGFKVESGTTKENDYLWSIKFKISWDLTAE